MSCKHEAQKGTMIDGEAQWICIDCNKIIKDY